MPEFKYLVCVTIYDTRTDIKICDMDTLGFFRNHILARQEAMKRAHECIKSCFAVPPIIAKYHISADAARAMVEDGVIDFEALGYKCEVKLIKKL